jgi:predicted transcriptional regulator
MTVNKAKQAKLERKGWKFSSAHEFLGLSAQELAYIELRLALSDTLKSKRVSKKLTQAELARSKRVSKKLTQAELARILNSSQSRVAKMEAGDPTVSIDLLIKSLLALGVSKKELGRSIL